MPTNAAGTIVFNADKTQVLLCKREDFRIWTHPGGGVEADESFEDAAIRETFEETGYRVAIDRFVGRYLHPWMPNGGVLAHVFQAHVIGGSATKCFESIDLGFFPVNALPPRTIRWTYTHIADALTDHGQVIERTEMLPIHYVIFVRIGLVLRDLRNKYILKHEQGKNEIH